MIRWGMLWEREYWIQFSGEFDYTSMLNILEPIKYQFRLAKTQIHNFHADEFSIRVW